MKLAQYTKDAICRAILDDLPKLDEDALISQIKAALYKAMSPECKRLHNKKPSALASSSLHRAELYVSVPVGDADLDAVLEPFIEARKARQRLRDQVRIAVNGCSTRKQLVDRYPEFSKYLPSEHGVCTTLPAPANVIADLVKAGWVQTVFKSAEK